MTSFLTFIGVLALLLTQGTLLARLLLRSNLQLSLALALPFGALTNVLLIFLWTITSVPLTPLSLLGPHALLALAFGILLRKETIPPESTPVGTVPRTRAGTAITIICSLLLVIVSIYSFSHAILLPTFQYDSATNWTMRSQVSFVDRHIAFDTTEDRGMAKPQYPFLFHALQITANQGQARWNDTAANAILFVLSLGSFAAVFLLLARSRGRLHALVTTTLIVGIPQLSLHLAQGYADINLVQSLLLSLACLAAALEETGRRRAELLASALFVASAVWTKSEGVVFGLLPWLLILGTCAWKKPPVRRDACFAAGVALLLSLPWELFAWAKGLSLTPHSSDTMVSFRAEGLGDAFFGLMSRGSFGITWYVLFAVTGLLLLLFRRRDPRIERRSLPLLAWGWFVFLTVLFIYLMTPNVRFLLNGESYYRQMMVPSSMLILACGYCFVRRRERVS